MGKKKKGLLLIGGLAVCTITGCGVKATIFEDEVTEATIYKQTTLKTVSMFGGTDANGKAYREICKEFMDEHPEIMIEDNSQPSDEEWKEMVNADFSVGNEPDVIQFFTDATADSIVATGKLVSVEEIQQEYSYYAADVYETALDSAKNTDGISRAVPTAAYWEGLYCNKDLFDQYGLELPTDWESLTVAVETFQKNGIIPIACSLSSVPHYWMEYLMLYASGVEEYTKLPDNAPEGWVRGLSYFQTLREMNAFPYDTDTVDDAYIGQLFQQKKAAMQLEGSWYAANIRDREHTVVVPFPGVPDQKANAGTVVGGISSGFYITRKAWENPTKREAAVKFVMAHTSRDGIQRYWEAIECVSQPIADVTKVRDDSPFMDSIEKYVDETKEMVSPTDARIGNSYRILISKIVKVSNGSLDAKDAIDEALEMR